MPSNTANDNSNLMFYCKCFSPRPANWLSPAASLLFTAWSLLAFTPMYNTQWSLGLTRGVTPAPNYVKACSHKMILDSSSRSNCQPVVFFFHSNYTKCIISILSCCHKHFRLRCSTEHLVCPARQHHSHWWTLMSMAPTPETARIHWSCAAKNAGLDEQWRCGAVSEQTLASLALCLSFCLWLVCHTRQRDCDSSRAVQ